MMRLVLFLGALIPVGAGLAQGPATTRATAPATSTAPVEKGPQARAILISGSGGGETYSRNLLDWSNRFADLLTRKCSVLPHNLIVLTETADPNASPPRRQATAENVKAAFEELTARLKPQDQFILYLAGQGQINEPVGKLCLPGRDLKADEVANWLDRLPTNKVVLVHCASGGAEFVKTCVLPGRVLITGAGVDTDGNQTYFAEFFLRGYETGRADANQDGVIDLMEAYLYSAHETVNFYHRQYLVSTRTDDPNAPLLWDVHGKETREIWRRLYAGTNNKLAEVKPGPNDPPRGDPDQEPDTEPKLGDYGPPWQNRRFLAEHARLDDTDGKQTFLLWKPYEFDDPPPDEPGQVGRLARRTALGRPQPVEVKPATRPATAPATAPK